MKYKYYFLSGTQEVRYDIGSASLKPQERVKVNSFRTFTVTFRTGKTPVQDGGSVRFSIPLPFSSPQNKNPRSAGYAKASSSRKDIKLSLSINPSPFTGFDAKDGHCGAYARSVFVRVRGGTLTRGDTITLHYSRARTPEYSSWFDFAVFVDPDGKRRAKNSGYYVVAHFPRLFVHAGKASKFTIYLRSNLKKSNPLTAVARDRDDNYDRNFNTGKKLTPGNIPLTFRKGIATTRVPDGNRDVLRVKIGQDISNPSKKIKDFTLYWGDLHSHSLLYDGVCTPDEVFDYARKVAHLDFHSVSEHSFYDPSMWQCLIEATNRNYVQGKFVTFAGYETRTTDFGDINFYFPGTSGPQPPPTKFNGSYNTYPLSRYIRTLKNKKVLVIPHCHLKPSIDYPAGFQKKYMPLIEIYSQWGNFEKSGRKFTLQKKRTVDLPRSIIHNLVSGLRFGFTAGSDNHSGHPGYGNQMRANRTFHGGLTAVYAKELTRKGIWNALMNRQCYATTGCRMIIGFSVNGIPMGSAKKGVPPQRVVHASVNGQGPLKKIVIVRNGKEVKSFRCEGKLDVNIEWTDKTDSSKLLLKKTKFSPSPFMFYYLRVEQENGEIGWASPVWFDKKKN